MKKNLFISLFMSLFLLIGILLPGCAAADTEKELVVAAASDLTKAFTEVGSSFEKANNCTVTFSFGSTGTLSEQIINGAPFDVFAAANESVIDSLDQNGHVLSDTTQLYALGRIGLTTLKDSPIALQNIEDLLAPEIKKIAIANPDHAPYGLAAKQTLESAGLWDQLESKLVYGKNISEALTFITTGNADAGIIALSLNDETALNFSLIGSEMHSPLKQAIAVIKTTNQEQLGRDFIAYVNSPEGQLIMNKYGFVRPGYEP